MAQPLTHDPDAILRMENSLRQLATDCFLTAGVSALVYGVFSLDELERKTENELNSKIAIGVQYMETAPVEIDFNPKGAATQSGGNAARMVAHKFLVILAVPTTPATGATDAERYNVTKLLTLLRRAIHGSAVDGDYGSRRWNFQLEKPNVGDSTETMLYYSQVWQVALPLVSLVGQN